MRKIIQLGVAILAATAAFCQNHPLPLTLDDVRMSDYLHKRGAAHLHISIVKSKKPLEGTVVKYTAVCPGPEFQRTGYTKLDAKGEATILLSDRLPYQQLWLDIEGYVYAGLLINTDLSLQVDASQIDTEQIYLAGNGLTFTGADADLNYATGKKILFHKNEQEQLNNVLAAASIRAANNPILIDRFLVTADSVYQGLLKINTEYARENPGMEWAIFNETNSLYYTWVLTAFSNKKLPASLFTKIINHKPYFTSNDGIGFYRQLSAYITSKSDNPKLDLQKALSEIQKPNTNGQYLLDSITTYEALAQNEENKKTLNQLYAQRYKIFSKEINGIRDRQALDDIDRSCSAPTGDILKLELMEYNKDRFTEAYPAILKSMKTGWTKTYVQKKIQESLAKQKEINELFQSGQGIASDNYYLGHPVTHLAFNASLYILDSVKNIDEFILALKSKFHNKALILDFWATWCAPCLSDLPKSKKLHEENENLPIEYVYLCTSSGSDTETWKKRIGMLKVPGTHIFMNEELMIALRQKLNAEGGFPTYVVIDAKGNVNSKSIAFMGQIDVDTLKAVTGIN